MSLFTPDYRPVHTLAYIHAHAQVDKHNCRHISVGHVQLFICPMRQVVHAFTLRVSTNQSPRFTQNQHHQQVDTCASEKSHLDSYWMNSLSSSCSQNPLLVPMSFLSVPLCPPVHPSHRTPTTTTLTHPFPAHFKWTSRRLQAHIWKLHSAPVLSGSFHTSRFIKPQAS